MKSSVTVLVPIYRVEAYIAECVASIKQQSYREFSCILINDGTTDKSVEAAMGVIGEDRRFRWLHQTNNGYGSALENALKQVDTPYFLVCDGDDRLKKNCLEVLVSLAEKTQADIVAGARNNFFEGENLCHYDGMCEQLPKKEEGISFDSEDFCAFLNMNPAPHAKLYRHTLAKEIAFLHRISYTDNQLFYLSAARARCVVYTPLALAEYRLDRPGNSMGAQLSKMVSSQIRVFSEILRQLGKEKECHPFLFYRMFTAFMYLLYSWGKSAQEDGEITANLYAFLQELQARRSSFYKYHFRYSGEKIWAKGKQIFLWHPLFSRKVYTSWLKKLKGEL